MSAGHICLSSWLKRLSVCLTFFLICQGARAQPAEFERQVFVKVADEPKPTGYDVTSVPRDGMLRLTLTVDESDPNCDFEAGSGDASGALGVIKWRDIQNDNKRFRARSETFQRNRNIYAVLTRGDWDCPAGDVGGEVPEWKVGVLQVQIVVTPDTYPTTNKLLATATHALSAIVIKPPGVPDPRGPPAWLYPGDAIFDPVFKLETKFIAFETLTPVARKDQDEVKIRIPVDSATLADDQPLNITAPQRFLVGNGVRLTQQRVTLQQAINNRKLTLLSGKVIYQIRDQFGDKISQTDRGQPALDVLKVEKFSISGDPIAVDFFADIPKTDPPEPLSANEYSLAAFRDDIGIGSFPSRALLDPATGRQRFYEAGHVVLDVRQVWFMSVEGKLEVSFTDNPLEIKVLRVSEDGLSAVVDICFNVNITRP